MLNLSLTLIAKQKKYIVLRNTRMIFLERMLRKCVKISTKCVRTTKRFEAADSQNGRQRFGSLKQMIETNYLVR